MSLQAPSVVAWHRLNYCRTQQERRQPADSAGDWAVDRPGSEAAAAIQRGGGSHLGGLETGAPGSEGSRAVVWLAVAPH